jgi:hypothetical protein
LLDDELTEVDDELTLGEGVEVEADVEFEVLADDELDVGVEALALVAGVDEEEVPGIV